jgi:hypothetical protein
MVLRRFTSAGDGEETLTFTGRAFAHARRGATTTIPYASVRALRLLPGSIALELASGRELALDEPHWPLARVARELTRRLSTSTFHEERKGHVMVRFTIEVLAITTAIVYGSIFAFDAAGIEQVPATCGAYGLGAAFLFAAWATSRPRSPGVKIRA